MRSYERYTSLIRPIDLTYKTNLAIVVISIIFGFLFADGSIALNTFFAWALAREIDYKNELGAFLSLPLIFVFANSHGAGNNFILFSLLLLLRLFSQTNTVAVKSWDYFIAFGALAVATTTLTGIPTQTLRIIGATVLGVLTYRAFSHAWKIQRSTP